MILFLVYRIVCEMKMCVVLSFPSSIKTIDCLKNIGQSSERIMIQLNYDPNKDLSKNQTTLIKI